MVVGHRGYGRQRVPTRPQAGTARGGQEWRESMLEGENRDSSIAVL